MTIPPAVLAAALAGLWVGLLVTIWTLLYSYAERERAA
jgi:hypothetical protein